MREAVDQIIEFKQAGLRKDANDETLDTFMRMVETYVQQLTGWSNGGKPDIATNIQEYQALLSNCPSPRVEQPMAALTALLAGCQANNVKAALGSALDASFAKDVDVKTLQQALAAAAKTPVDKTNAAKKALARPKVWN